MRTVSKPRHFQEEASHVAHERRMRVFLRRVFLLSFVIGALMIGGMSYWLSSSGIFRHYSIMVEEGIFQKTARLGLTLQNVYLEGQHFTDRKDILTALDVKIGQPILSIPITRIRERLEQLDWVQYAMVDRQLPHTLHIRIIERTPIAIWQNARQFYLVDTEGSVIVTDHIERFSHLIVLVGDDAPLYAGGLLAALHSQPKLAKQVVSGIRIGERRWNIRFKNGMEVKLPEDNLDTAWQMLTKLTEQSRILPTTKEVDLRIMGKVYMK